MATTKVVNIFSSAIATLIFAWHGVVDYKLGVILSVTMFLGAIIGGHVTMRLNPIWLRRIFVVAVLGLAAKMVFAFLQQ